MLEKAKGTN